MTTLYKLTDQRMQTYNGFQWALSVGRIASGAGGLCGSGWLHAYTDPILAMLLNPIHANIASPRLFWATGEVGLSDHGLKVGCTRLTLVEELPLPSSTIEQQIKFGILCAKEVCDDLAWNIWADRWLSGEDRSENGAANAARAACRAAVFLGTAYAAAYAATYTAAMAAYTYAAPAPARAAATPLISQDTGRAATHAAHIADIDLISIAHRALEE